MRWSIISSVWLLATATPFFALPSGDYSSHASNVGVKRGPEPGAAPPLDKRTPAGPPTGKGVYTKDEWSWLEQKAAADASVHGLKNIIATLNDLFGRAKVPWIASGGWPLILYGEPNRKTTDMDIMA
ncbi:hypothetical protein PspLS_11271 [Pyricularia sp. CBS 133598]|nr:hypothetical protein PspLS_11271 [Pyricularia sp. CBS 133598]